MTDKRRALGNIIDAILFFNKDKEEGQVSIYRYDSDELTLELGFLDNVYNLKLEDSEDDNESSKL